MLKFKGSRFPAKIRFILAEGLVVISIIWGLLLLQGGKIYSCSFCREGGLILLGGGIFWGLFILFIAQFRLSMGMLLVLNLLEILALLLKGFNFSPGERLLSLQLILTGAILNSLLGFSFFVGEKIRRSSYERKFTEFLLRRNVNQISKEKLIQVFSQYVDESNQVINHLIGSLKQLQKTLK